MCVGVSLRIAGQKALEMAKNEGDARTYSNPSPGQILSRARQEAAAAGTAIDASRAPFGPTLLGAALKERGVVLAPVLVVWHYRVVAANPFARWLRTKDIILSGARLGLRSETADTHYFGTYFLQPPLPTAAVPGQRATSAIAPMMVQTFWGFSSEAAMEHMFDLCRGRIDRVSIVENDLYDFVSGLREHMDQAGQSHFSQAVLLAPATL